MSDEKDGKHNEGSQFKAPMNGQSHVKKLIAVVSGKGGVGKSLITALLAVLVNRKGYKTAILDADITGPSIPKAFGLHEKAAGTDNVITPVRTKTGISIMSLNLLLEHETDPVVWRGPLIAGAVKQFWTDVVWGNIDFMFLDMPPGTGDVPLTVFQSLPVTGIVVVTSPQELVGKIVEKAVNMASMMHIPVLGVVENMSYYVCPTCGTKQYIFGESHADVVAESHGIHTLCRLPIRQDLAKAVDGGAVESLQENGLDGLVNTILA